MRMKDATAPDVARGPRAPRLTLGRLMSVLALTTLLAALLPGTARADVLAQAKSVSEVLGNIRTWLMAILASLATVFLTIGGVRYVMAGGDPGEVEKAKTAFKAAGIGFLLAALAPVLVAVLEGFVS
jgi:hypothetical protein